MSMNLVYDVKDIRGFVEFPIQTPTELTYAVLGAKSVDEQVELLNKTLIEWGYEGDHLKDLMYEIVEGLTDPKLEISLI